MTDVQPQSSHSSNLDEFRRRYSWTQPCCDHCWSERHGAREPARLIERERQECVYCADPTHSGIFVRVDPASAYHPTNLRYP